MEEEELQDEEHEALRRLFLHILDSFMHRGSTFTTSQSQARSEHHTLYILKSCILTKEAIVMHKSPKAMPHVVVDK